MFYTLIDIKYTSLHNIKVNYNFYKKKKYMYTYCIEVFCGPTVVCGTIMGSLRGQNFVFTYIF